MAIWNHIPGFGKSEEKVEADKAKGKVEAVRHKLDETRHKIDNKLHHTTDGAADHAKSWAARVGGAVGHIKSDLKGGSVALNQHKFVRTGEIVGGGLIGLHGAAGIVSDLQNKEKKGLAKVGGIFAKVLEVGVGAALMYNAKTHGQFLTKSNLGELYGKLSHKGQAAGTAAR